MPKDNTLRFANRVEDYVKYRPGYPVTIISYLQDTCGLEPGATVADIGAGTGISSALFLDAGYVVLGVEPNKEMREKAEELLGKRPGFTITAGTAEQTELNSHCVDAIVAGQAFHWFDVQKSKAEFQRILKPGGFIALIWNERETGSDFEQAYDQLISKHGKDYVEVQHRNIQPENIAAFLQPGSYRSVTFPNSQVFDFDGLKGRLQSSSYMPATDDPGHAPMIADLKELFDTHQSGGHITIHYTTKVYTGLV